MLQLVVPGANDLLLAHLVCDVNGTLAVDGQMSQSVSERLLQLTEHLQIHLVSADTHGTLAALAAHLQEAGGQVQMARVATGADKVDYVQRLGPETVVTIGNGINDVGMFALARLSIAVCGAEGLAVAALQAATLIVPTIEVALDLLLHPRRLTATLRP
jgi:soluble P-type ATPase